MFVEGMVENIAFIHPVPVEHMEDQEEEEILDSAKPKQIWAWLGQKVLDIIGQ